CIRGVTHTDVVSPGFARWQRSQGCAQCCCAATTDHQAGATVICVGPHARLRAAANGAAHCGAGPCLATTRDHAPPSRHAQVAAPDATAAATVGFVEAVDHARYAPVPPDATARRELLERARRLVDQLDALGSKQKQRSRTTVATLAAVAAFGAAAHATSAQQ